jgi:hypothetical protein
LPSAGYAVVSGAAAAEQEEVCQTTLNTLDGNCGGD